MCWSLFASAGYMMKRYKVRHDISGMRSFFMQAVAQGAEVLNLTDYIYNDLLNKLQCNILLPGTLIDRKVLAKEYQVSVAPVRDALQRLTFEGFIETKTRSATVVKAVQKDDIYGFMVLREALESQAIRIIDKETLAEAKDKLMELAKAVDSCDRIMDYWEADISFHKNLVALTKCNRLISTYEQIMNIGMFYQVNSYFSRMDTSSVDSHVKLLNALLNSNKDDAEKAMRQHLNDGKSFVDR